MFLKLSYNGLKEEGFIAEASPAAAEAGQVMAAAPQSRQVQSWCLEMSQDDGKLYAHHYRQTIDTKV